MSKQVKHWLDGALPLIRAIAKAIEKKRGVINDLNLFPVPDGDTGTNLSMMLSAMVADLAKMPRRISSAEAIRAVARSANMHAKGNSGTILAAIIVGAAEILEGAETLSPEIVAQALENANRKARSRVMNPTEGTMLTVIKDMAETARRCCDEGVESAKEMAKPVLQAAINATDESEAIMREVLGKSRVGKDAGAYGLTTMVETAVRKVLTDLDDLGDWSANGEADTYYSESEYDHDWIPGTPLYCTEFVLIAEKESGIDEEAIYDFLQEIGDCAQFNYYSGTAKVHVHTNSPDQVLKYFLQLGELSEVEVHNMRLQSEEAQIKSARVLESVRFVGSLGVVAVASGEGASQLLSDLGVDEIVDGGQSNNPEVKDLYDAIRRVNAKVVLVFPGNKNVILAARQAAEIVQNESEGKIEVRVVPTADYAQTVNALLLLPDRADRDVDYDGLVKQMTDEANSTKSALIAKAAKDYSDGRFDVFEGQFLSLVKDKIVAVSDNILAAIVLSLRELSPTADGAITVYLGADFKASAKILRNMISDRYPNATVDLVWAGQSVYDAIVSAT